MTGIPLSSTTTCHGRLAKKEYCMPAGIIAMQEALGDLSHQDDAAPVVQYYRFEDEL